MDEIECKILMKHGMAWIRQYRVRYLSFIGLGVCVFISLMEDQLRNMSFDFTATVENQGQNSSTIIFAVKRNLLNDKTVPWDPTVDRMWLDTRQERRPPAMILLTSYGWNRLDQIEALSHYSRQTRESEFLDGIVNHPWFHPTAWDDIENGDNVTIQSILGLDDDNYDNEPMNTTMISTRFYIFFDVSSNCDIHYPLYHSFDVNLDTSGGRVDFSSNVMYKPNNTLQHPIWQSRFITQLGTRNLNQVKVIYFDCNSEMHPDFDESRKNHGDRKSVV